MRERKLSGFGVDCTEPYAQPGHVKRANFPVKRVRHRHLRSSRPRGAHSRAAGDDLPRQIEFLYFRNRLNVAPWSDLRTRTGPHPATWNKRQITNGWSWPFQWPVKRSKPTRYPVRGKSRGRFRISISLAPLRYHPFRFPPFPQKTSALFPHWVPEPGDRKRRSMPGAHGPRWRHRGFCRCATAFKTNEPSLSAACPKASR